MAAFLVCVGVFLPWIEASNELLVLERSGWHVGADGRLALAAGFVAAAAAGVAWVGVRHLFLKTVLATTAVVLLAVFVVELLDVLDFEDRLAATNVSASTTAAVRLRSTGHLLDRVGRRLDDPATEPVPVQWSATGQADPGPFERCGHGEQDAGATHEPKSD
ncbi:MAG: hypothetical protein MUE34_04775, partial [Acidimicrobiales bacterium]|nr:hypothetical protein [Acidimicrobiales bacterium]